MISESTKYLYNRLPEVYRKADINGGNETLLRFLSALDDGGFRTLNLDIEKLYNIMSIEKAPQELIPVIGNMLGYKYVKEVDDRTQRKIVENLVELYKRNPTYTVTEDDSGTGDTVETYNGIYAQIYSLFGGVSKGAFLVLCVFVIICLLMKD